jgi:hypothetical protein
MRKMTHVVVQSVMQEAEGWKRVLRDAFKLRVSDAAWVNYNASSPFTPPRLIKTLIATTKIVRAACRSTTRLGVLFWVFPSSSRIILPLRCEASSDAHNAERDRATHADQPHKLIIHGHQNKLECAFKITFSYAHS